MQRLLENPNALEEKWIVALRIKNGPADGWTISIDGCTISIDGTRFGAYSQFEFDLFVGKLTLDC